MLQQATAAAAHMAKIMAARDAEIQANGKNMDESDQSKTETYSWDDAGSGGGTGMDEPVFQDGAHKYIVASSA